jgi:ribosomal protein S27E
MGITEKAAYLKGLFDGYEIDATAKEGKIISELLTLVADMADEISALKADNRELHEYVEELDHDLGEVEEEVYFVDEDDYDEDDEDFEDEDDEFIGVECPSCGEMVYFDETIDTDKLVCPVCGEKITGIELCDGDCTNCNDVDCKNED